jgi:hypothetical protein
LAPGFAPLQQAIKNAGSILCCLRLILKESTDFGVCRNSPSKGKNHTAPKHRAEGRIKTAAAVILIQKKLELSESI